MTKFTITLDDEEIRKVVLAELYESFNIVIDSTSTHEEDIAYDKKIAKALARVIKYYASPKEFDELFIDQELLFKEQRH